MNNILNTILKDSYTLTQLKHRLAVLKADLLQNLYGNQMNQKFEAQDVNWLKSLPANFYQSFNKDNTTTLFSDLEKAADLEDAMRRMACM